MQAQGNAQVNVVVVANNQATLDAATEVVKKGVAQAQSDAKVNVSAHVVGETSSNAQQEGKTHIVVLAAETQDDFEKVKAEYQAQKSNFGEARAAVVAKSDDEAKKWATEVGANTSFTLNASAEALSALAAAAKSALSLNAGANVKVGAGLGL